MVTGRFSKLARLRRPLRRFTRRNSSSGSAWGGTSSGLTGLRSSSSAKFSSICARSPRLEPVRARTVIPLLVAIQLHLHTKILNLQIFRLQICRRPAAAAPRHAAPALRHAASHHRAPAAANAPSLAVIRCLRVTGITQVYARTHRYRCRNYAEVTYTATFPLLSFLVPAPRS